MIPRDAGRQPPRSRPPSIADAHAAGPRRARLDVPRENQFLPRQFRSGADRQRAGDLVGEMRAFLAAGMDGFFTDNPAIGVAAVS